jgi:peptidyl-tRNA hydrolase
MDFSPIQMELLSMGFSEEQVFSVRGVASLEEAVEVITAGAAKDYSPVAPEDETRMVIVVRSDLKMGVGKIASQVAHAAVALFDKMQRKHGLVLEAWERNNTPKVCLRCDTLQVRVSRENQLHIVTSFMEGAGQHRGGCSRRRTCHCFNLRRGANAGRVRIENVRGSGRNEKSSHASHRKVEAFVM